MDDGDPHDRLCPQSGANELGVADRIPTPQPTRLLSQPEDPLKATLLHPQWCLGLVPRDEVERSAYGKMNRGHLLRQSCSLQILLGRTQADPDDLSSRLMNALRLLCALVLR
jgi:hypothetical protein